MSRNSYPKTDWKDLACTDSQYWNRVHLNAFAHKSHKSISFQKVMHVLRGLVFSSKKKMDPSNFWEVMGG